MTTTNKIEHLERVKRATLAFQRFQWEQGVTAQAFLELGDRNMAFLLARAAAYRNAPDGRIGVMGENRSVDDPAASGEALVRAAEETGDLFFREAADRLYFYLKQRAPKSRDGILYHFNILNQIWVDAYYMAPPFLAVMGDYAEAMKQIRGFRKALFDEKKGLHSHIWDDDLGTFGRRDFWGVGNGWAMAGVTRVLHLLPADWQAERQELEAFLIRMIEGCLQYQREDGLYHDVLDRPESFVDTNTAQMAAYAIYRGVAGGYLPEAWLVRAELSRAAVHRKVDRYGFVQGVCGLPEFDRPYVAPEGQAFFLLMEAAARDYYGA